MDMKWAATKHPIHITERDRSNWSIGAMALAPKIIATTMADFTRALDKWKEHRIFYC